MPKIVLHFNAEADADVDELAVALQQRAAELPGVEHAEAEGDSARSIDVQEVILILTVAGTVLEAGAYTLNSLKHFIESLKAFAEPLGLREPTVEVGDENVSPSALTPSQAETLRKS